MSGKLIALIRGINVGRAKRVAMADLRELMGDLGYSNVRTLLNSGNIVYTAPNDSAANSAIRIEEGLAALLGISAKVFVITEESIAKVVKENPLGNVASDPSRLLVAFLEFPESRTLLEPLLEEDWDPEVMALGSNVVYFWCPDGVLASSLAKAIGKVLGNTSTTRNWATVMKLYDLCTNVHAEI